MLCVEMKWPVTTGQAQPVRGQVRNRHQWYEKCANSQCARKARQGNQGWKKKGGRGEEKRREKKKRETRCNAELEGEWRTLSLSH